MWPLIRVSRLGIFILPIIMILGACGLTSDDGGSSSDTSTSQSRERTYFIASDEVDWDFAPTGQNEMMGAPFDETANVFVLPGPDRIGRVYKKAVYREYTDDTFTQLKPVPPEWAHKGVLGPVIRAVVGDTIKVVFRNNCPGKLFAIHPHGVFYNKDAEGAPYNDGTSGTDKTDDDVPFGQTHTYNWSVPERAGPGPGDPSSVVWLYHSHADEPADTNAGLIGVIIITRADKVGDPETAKPGDVEKEFVTLFTVFDENGSWYLQDNIQKVAAFGGDPALVNPDDPGFQESNLMHSINGYVYGNLPMPTMKKGDRVRWYLIGMGTEVDIHTPHWHGNTVDWKGSFTDVVEVFPASMTQADMVADNPGIWMFHCHVNDHITAGMIGRYQVEP